MSAICDRHDVEYLPALGCSECANERCIPERLARHEIETMPPSAADAMAEAFAIRMAREGEAGVCFDRLMALLAESQQNLEDIGGEA